MFKYPLYKYYIMDTSQDWCFFEKIWEKPLSAPTQSEFAVNLISISEPTGWIFICDSTTLHITNSSSILTYPTTPTTQSLSFDSPITQISCDKQGIFLALVQKSEVLILKIQDLVQGTKNPQKIDLKAPVRSLEWNQDLLGILTLKKTLEIWDFNKKIIEKDSVSYFAFLDENTLIVANQTILSTLDINQNQYKLNHDSGIETIGLAFFQGFIFQYAINENMEPCLNVYDRELGLAINIDFLDSYPFAPQENLVSGGFDLPFISFFYSFDQRETVLMSSTCSTSVDVVIKNPDFDRVNFEENLTGQCKSLWSNTKENTLRGFCVIKKHADPKEPYDFPLKDTVYTIAQPPLVLFLDSGGTLQLRRFIDLRRQYIDDRLCESIQQEESKSGRGVQVPIKKPDEICVTPKKPDVLNEKSEKVLGANESFNKGQNDVIKGMNSFFVSKESEKNQVVSKEPEKSTFVLGPSKSNEKPSGLVLDSNKGFFNNLAPATNTLTPQVSTSSTPTPPGNLLNYSTSASNPFNTSTPVSNPFNASTPASNPFNTLAPGSNPFNSESGPTTSGFFNKPEGNSTQGPKPFMDPASNPFSKEPATKSTAPTPLNPEIAPVSAQRPSFSSSLIKKIEILMQSILTDLKNSADSIEKIQINTEKSSNNSKILEKKCLDIVDSYLKTTEKVRNLQEKTDILEAQKDFVHKNFLLLDPENEDENKFDFYDKINDWEKSLKVSEFYYQSALKPITKLHTDIYKDVALNKEIVDLSNIKKTRSFQAVKPLADSVTEENLKKAARLSAKKLNRSIKALKSKLECEMNTPKKPKKTVYKFEIQESDEEPDTNQPFNYIDPSEYKKLKFNKIT